jgi:hypothetical protein
MTIDDERVRFYLRHREQLEEWFELRPEVASAVDKWLLDVAESAKALTDELEGRVEFVAEYGENTRWPAIYFKRPAWPDVKIGMMWARGGTLLVGSDGVGIPWYGLRCEKGTPLAEPLRLDAEFLQQKRERKRKSNQWWVAWELLPPPESFPQDEAEYRASVLNSLKAAWAEYAPFVDRIAAGQAIVGEQAVGVSEDATVGPV